ncbi:MAG: hypothetical protein M3Q95_12525 [Bacteroidota bacterium]|nr:hypothetical protein [Bacteroidota bacterium]
MNFSAKKAIVGFIIDKVVGTKYELQVYGYIPIENINVFTIDRNRQGTNRHFETYGKIPFEFNLKLPPARRERIILSRNSRGQITNSKSV